MKGSWVLIVLAIIGALVVLKVIFHILTIGFLLGIIIGACLVAGRNLFKSSS